MTPFSLTGTRTGMHCHKHKYVLGSHQFIHRFIDFTGFDSRLEPIEQNMMDGGSWHWEYRLRGAHIQLEVVEL